MPPLRCRAANVARNDGPPGKAAENRAAALIPKLGSIVVRQNWQGLPATWHARRGPAPPQCGRAG